MPPYASCPPTTKPRKLPTEFTSTRTNEAQVKQQTREATAEEKLAMLDEKRSQLMSKKMGLERKLAELEARKAGATREESQEGRERRR